MNGRIASAAALAAAGLPFALVTPAALAQRATFQGIGHLPGGAESAALAVSADGRVVAGRAVAPEGPAAFRWTSAEGFQILEPAPGWGGPGWNWYPTAASADGSAIVGSGDTPARTSVAFRWTPATGMEDLGDLSGGEVTAQAHGISGDGSIVVGFSEAEIPGGFTAPQAFRWTETGGMETFLPLSYTFGLAISLDGNAITGLHGCDGFYWTASTGMLLLECEEAPVSLSSDGGIGVGTAGWGSFHWLRESGIARGLTDRSGSSWVSEISDDGRIIVGTDRNEACLWDETLTFHILRDILTSDYGLDLTGWRLSHARDISADGTVIVGWGENPAGQEEGWIARLGNGPCYADCDASSAIDFFDFLCFQEAFAAGEPWADCDGSGQLDVFDFLCFQNAFVAGCS